MDEKVSLQKESEWKEGLKNNFFHPFYSYYTGFGWEKIESREDIPDNYPKGAEVREHLPDEEIEKYKELESFISKAISQREKEIAEDVNKLKKYHKEFECNGAHNGRGCYESWCEDQECRNAPKEYNQAITDVLSILKH
jgi:hypothetical protein